MAARLAATSTPVCGPLHRLRAGGLALCCTIADADPSRGGSPPQTPAPRPSAAAADPDDGQHPAARSRRLDPGAPPRAAPSSCASDVTRASRPWRAASRRCAGPAASAWSSRATGGSRTTSAPTVVHSRKRRSAAAAPVAASAPRTLDRHRRGAFALGYPAGGTARRGCRPAFAGLRDAEPSRREDDRPAAFRPMGRRQSASRLRARRHRRGPRAPPSRQRRRRLRRHRRTDGAPVSRSCRPRPNSRKPE